MKTVNKQKDHVIVITAPLPDNGEQKEPMPTYVTPTFKQKVVLLSSSKDNLAKILLLQMFGQEEQKGQKLLWALQQWWVK